MIKIVDHKGNEYPSVKAMCKAYNISTNAFYKRRNLGWDLETILTTPMIEKKGKEIEDHLGMKYSSVTEMCKVYGIDLTIYHHRIKAGYNQEEALTGKNIPKIGNPKMCVDHLGVEYPSEAAMCKSYNISLDTYKSRIRLGRSIEEALTRKKVYDHKGNEYPSVTEMCKVYGVNLHVYLGRIKSGYSMEEALTKKKVYDHKGNEYLSVKAMCAAYNVNSDVYHHRIKAGYCVEEALTGKRNK